MRLTRRLRDLAAGTDTDAEADTAGGAVSTDPVDPAPAPDARGDRPVATFARVLDGDALWLIVLGVPAGTRFALRRLDEVVAHLLPEHEEALPDGVSLRAVLDLPDLPRPAPGERERTVLVAFPPAPDGGPAPAPVRVWTPPLPPLAPARTPRCTFGDWQHEVRRADDGAVLLTRAGLDPAVPVAALGQGETDGVDVLEARLVPPAGGPAARSAELCDEAGAVVATAPVHHEDGHAVLRLAADEVPGDPGAVWLVRLDGAPAVRADHAIAAPDAAVVLPGLFDDGPSPRPIVRWRFLPDGALAVVRPRGAGVSEESDR